MRDAGSLVDGGGAVDGGAPVDAGAEGDAGIPPWDGGLDPSDTVLVPPRTDGRDILATITGYEMNEACQGISLPSRCEVPLYTPYDRDQQAWWDDLVEELAFSRIQVTMLHGRGCLDPANGTTGNGNMCPLLLSHFVQAVQEKGLQDVLRVGMFDDTGAYQGARNQVLGLDAGTLFDLSDESSWSFFWDRNMEIWFDTIPSSLLFEQNGRPVVAFWTLSSAFFTNQSGNASRLLDWLRNNMIQRYGLDPIFLVDDSWFALDPTMTAQQASGQNAWFDPSQNTFTVTSFDGATWGAAVPGYRNPDTDPGCGASCREQLRNNGDALRTGLSFNRGSELTLLEGFTNVIESAGYYRSPAWDIPNRYLGATREAVDFETETLRYEAEAADAFSDTTATNLGGAYRADALDVGVLPEGTGWFVGWVDPGEWIEFDEVHLSCGTYRWSARVSSPTGATVHLEVDGVSLGPVALPATGSYDAYQVVALGQVTLPEGRHTLRYVFDTAGSNLDWFFHHKRSMGCVQEQALLAETCPAGLSDRGSYEAPAYGSSVTAADFLNRPFASAQVHFCHQGDALVIAAGSCPTGFAEKSFLLPELGRTFVDSSGASHPWPEQLKVCTSGTNAFLRLGGCPSGATQTGLLYAPTSAVGPTVGDDTGATGQGTWAAFCAQ